MKNLKPKNIVIKVGFFLFPFLFSPQLFSQGSLTQKSWNVGDTLVLFENPIVRLEGFNSYGITNFGYRTLQQVKELFKKTANEEMWTSEKLNKMLLLSDKLSKGGRFYLYIERLTIGAANTENFTVIIKDTLDKEVFRDELKNSIPETPVSGSSYWRNNYSQSIPVNLTGVYDVYVIDKLGGDRKRFKFRIKI